MKLEESVPREADSERLPQELLVRLGKDKRLNRQTDGPQVRTCARHLLYKSKLYCKKVLTELLTNFLKC